MRKVRQATRLGLRLQQSLFNSDANAATPMPVLVRLKNWRRLMRSCDSNSGFMLRTSESWNTLNVTARIFRHSRESGNPGFLSPFQ